MMQSSLYLVDSTLREGEQFAHAHFTTDQKLEIAAALDAFGADYIELTSPRASQKAFDDCRTISGMGLRAKTLTHIRCHPDDAERALRSGVDGVNLMFGTSSYLRRYSHGRDIEAIIEAAISVITYLQQEGVEVRFSAEDSLRTDPEDLYRVYEAVDALGIQRVGVADTVGAGTPQQVGSLVAGLRARVRAGIEFHGHNDTGCAVANAHAAWENGAQYIDTCILGIGERNGITPLGAFIARIHADHPHITARYNLKMLPALDAMISRMTGVPVPFNNCITGSCAFTHKAGIHTKAVLNHPSSYEILRPEDFGLGRQVLLAHGLTGRHALAHRAQQLGLDLDTATLDRLTREIKEAAATGQLQPQDLDKVLRQYSPITPQEVPHVANAS